MEIMKLTIKEDFHRETCFFVFFFTKFNVHVPFKTSCELTGSFKIEMQMYKLLLVFSDPFHNYFSWKNFKDGLCILKIQ